MKKIVSTMTSLLNKHPFLQAVARLLHHRQDDCFINYINNLGENPYIVTVKGKDGSFFSSVEGLKDYHNLYCKITVGTPNDGFFACVRWALEALYFCDKMGYIPVLSFPFDSMYADCCMFDKSVNPFEYYFEKQDEWLPNLDEQMHVVYDWRNHFLANKMNNNNSYYPSDEYIEAMSYVMRKYLHFNNRTEEKIRESLSEFNYKGILGVHIRGTDYRVGYRNHPIFVEAKDYFPYIDSAINAHGFKKIFLATDDSNLLAEFLDYYGDDSIIYFKNVERGSTKVGVHAGVENKKTPFYLGLDVIIDMCALSVCDGIISGMSQVALAARIYKKSKGQSYDYDKVISKGIYLNGELYCKP